MVVPWATWRSPAEANSESFAKCQQLDFIHFYRIPNLWKSVKSVDPLQRFNTRIAFWSNPAEHRQRENEREDKSSPQGSADNSEPSQQ